MQHHVFAVTKDGCIFQGIHIPKCWSSWALEQTPSCRHTGFQKVLWGVQWVRSHPKNFLDSCWDWASWLHCSLPQLGVLNWAHPMTAYWDKGKYRDMSTILWSRLYVEVKCPCICSRYVVPPEKNWNGWKYPPVIIYSGNQSQWENESPDIFFSAFSCLCIDVWYFIYLLFTCWQYCPANAPKLPSPVA